MTDPTYPTTLNDKSLDIFCFKCSNTADSVDLRSGYTFCAA